MKQVKSIVLGLENLESISFTTKEIGRFYIGDIHESICRIGCNCISKQTGCKEFFIELLPCANHTYSCFGDTGHTFRRLEAYDDIASVDIVYEDGSKEEVYVPWGDDDQNNDHQTSYLSKSGALYILIKENGKLSDYIDFDEVDDENQPFLDGWYE